MALFFSSSSTIHTPSLNLLSPIFPALTTNLKSPQNNTQITKTQFPHSKILKTRPKPPIIISRETRKPARTIPSCSQIEESEPVDEDGVDDSPWEGAVIYKRSPSITHLEYCTTLERLGMGKFSTEISRSRASIMGLRVTKDVKDYPLGTPVQISIDITRKKQKLKLDGIVRTVITLGCNRCAQPAAECIFSNFSLLLTEEPIEEEDEIDMGLIFGEGKSKTYYRADDGEGEEDEDLIDMDDRLYFPSQEKEIDISKQIRDIVHVEITINAICDANCKGVCLKCGTNLNWSNCDCSKQGVEQTEYGPLGNLRKQVRQR